MSRGTTSSRKGLFSKGEFNRYVSSNCQRQLFLELSERGENWDDWRLDETIIEYDKSIERPIQAFQLREGKKYQEEIYSELHRIGHLQSTYNPNLNQNPVIRPPAGTHYLLLPETIRSLIKVATFTPVLLIEHKYQVPQDFEDRIFELHLSSCIPDILYLRSIKSLEGNFARLVTKTGSVESVDIQQNLELIVVSVIDIKSTAIQNVSNKHFSEILYYLQTLNAWVYENKLEDVIRISIEDNGIFARSEKFRPTLIQEIVQDAAFVLLPYDDVEILWDQFVNDLNAVNLIKPTSRQSFPVNFGVYCEQCDYLYDCFNQCGVELLDNNQQAFTVDTTVDIIPNLTTSIKLQLRDRQIISLRQLQDSLDQLGSTELPHPFNSEIPTLRQKVPALISNQVIPATQGSYYSTSIPRFSNNVVSFVIEKEPTSDYSYLFSLSIDSRYSREAGDPSIRRLYLGWLQVFDQYLASNSPIQSGRASGQAATDHILPILSARGFPNISEADCIQFLQSLDYFYKHELFYVDRESNQRSNVNYELRIPDIANLSPRERAKSPSFAANLTLSVSIINLDYTPDHELTFTKQVVQTIYHAIRIVMLLERYIISTYQDDRGRDRIRRLSTAVYYWSHETMETIQELLERHLLDLISDNRLMWKLELILNWIKPAGQPADPSQLSKVYDLSSYFHEALGIPTPITYTWHRIAQHLIEGMRPVNFRNWSLMFNSLNWGIWYQYLMVRDQNFDTARSIHDRIKQLGNYKSTRIIRMVRIIQARGTTRTLISNNFQQRPAETREFVEAVLPRGYHFPARVWFVFAKFEETYQELVMTKLRSTYTELGVAKLESAEVTNLEAIPLVIDDETVNYEYRFQFQDLSRFTKLKAGDRVYLIPILIRDNLAGFELMKWEINLLEKQYNPTTQSYDVLAVSSAERRRTVNLIDEAIENLDNNQRESDLTWFLFPTPVSAWATKLFKLDTQTTRRMQNSLLERHQIGQSFLGFRMDQQYNFSYPKNLRLPDNLQFTIQEILMLAPHLLPMPSIEPVSDFLTTVSPVPDASQAEAIHWALSAPLTLIQGPPGTGKSQTIVAIIDEFLHRRHKRGHQHNRILISTFSYAALHVLIDNVSKSREQSSDSESANPTLAATTQKIYLRSEYRQPYVPSSDHASFQVDDLLKLGGGDRWEFNGERITPQRGPRLEEFITRDVILFSNAHQLYHLLSRGTTPRNQDRWVLSQEAFEFDLIIIDEASQYPTTHYLSAIQTIRTQTLNLVYNGVLEDGRIHPSQLSEFVMLNDEQINTHVIIVGDHKQLPPVQPVKPPERLKPLLGSVFDYFVDETSFDLRYRPLRYNYRSNRVIVNFINSIHMYDAYLPAPESQNAETLFDGDFSNIDDGWIRTTLDPQNVISVITHDQPYDTSLSLLELQITIDLIIQIYVVRAPDNEEGQRDFWQETIGIVAPHNAHGSSIINQLHQRVIGMDLNQIEPEELQSLLSDSIYTVEKFQGSEREIIVGTIGVSDVDQLRFEEEFIFDRNRLNVLVTRAKHKLIFICSQNFLQHVPQDRERFLGVGFTRKLVNYCTMETEEVIDFQGTPTTIKIFTHPF
ncbi:MAG: AAA family ATPase [Candidatus Heimdallarchaeota archaeon]|nr:AAA family ATPase [Candidatus Heimdallarchaeota archaeon]